MWDLATCECLAYMYGHSEVVTDLKFTSDGQRLITVGADGCMFVWRLNNLATAAASAAATAAATAASSFATAQSQFMASSMHSKHQQQQQTQTQMPPCSVFSRKSASFASANQLSAQANASEAASLWV